MLVLIPLARADCLIFSKNSKNSAEALSELDWANKQVEVVKIRANKQPHLKPMFIEKIVKISLILPLFLLLFACGEKVHILTGTTMGTTYQIKYISHNQIVTKTMIDDYLSYFNRVFSSWDKTSELSTINQAPTGQWLNISPSLSEVLKIAQMVHQKSDGYFDIAMGRALDLWGFYQYQAKQKPSQDAILKTKAQNGMAYLEVQPKKLKKTRDIWLDLSALAKGYAIDELAQFLKQKGMQNFLIEIGGEILASGQNNSKPWLVGIQNTTKSIVLVDQSIATSGNYHNFVRLGQQNYGHIFNPKTTQPAQSDFLSVSVIHPSTTLADAYATAIMVMDAKRAKKFIEQQQLSAILVYDNQLRTIETIGYE